MPLPLQKTNPSEALVTPGYVTLIAGTDGAIYAKQSDGTVALVSSAGTQFANNVQSLAGTSTTLAVTPAGLKYVLENTDATTAEAGLVVLATPAEVATGTDNVKAATAAGVALAIVESVGSVTQGHSANLDEFSAVNPSTLGKSLVQAGTQAEAQTLLGISAAGISGNADALLGTTLAPNVVNSSLTSAAGGAFGTAAYANTTAFDAAGAAAAAQAAAVAASQPLDADLTAIAAQGTTSFGRGLLNKADAAALTSTILPATTSTTGTVEKATDLEAVIGTANTFPDSSTLLSLKANVQPTQALQVGGTLRAFGDSQTYGTNSAYPGDRIPPEFRWVNILATQFDRNMSIADTNFAVGGTNMGFSPSGDPYYWQSHFNQLSNLPYDWEGTVAAMMGFNNVLSTTIADATFDAMLHAYTAWIGRAMSSRWYGMTHLGWNNLTTDGGASGQTPGWACSVGSTLSVLPSGLNTYNPYPVAALPYNQNAIALTAGSSLSFTATASCVMLSFLTRNDGGAFTVRVNETVAYVGSTFFSWGDVPGATSVQFPMGVPLYNLPIGATVKVSVAGDATHTVLWQAYCIPDPAKYSVRRLLISGPVSFNPGGQRTQEDLFRMWNVAQSAAAGWARLGVPVSVFGAYSAVNSVTDAQTGDPSHPNIVGNAHLAQAANSAFSPVGPTPDNFIDCGYHKLAMVPGGLGGGMSFAGADLKIRDYTSQLYVLNLEENAYRNLHAGAIRSWSGGFIGDGSQVTGVVGANVTNAPVGGIAATTVQGAINELDSEKAGRGTTNTFALTQTFTLPPVVPSGLGGGVLFGGADVKLREFSNQLYVLNNAENAYQNLLAGNLYAWTGDVEVIDPTKGVILKSPDGTRYRITVANGGALTTTAI